MNRLVRSFQIDQRGILSVLILVMWVGGCIPIPEPEHELMIDHVSAGQQLLVPDSISFFRCPQKKDFVSWMRIIYSSDMLTHGDTSCIFFTAREDGVPRGTSRIGAAISIKGEPFEILQAPILFPDAKDSEFFFDKEGVEEPRVVRDSHGSFWMTYNALSDGISRVSLARSKDLFSWTKLGSITEHASKSGVIVSSQSNQKKVAKKVDGFFHMYWGDKVIRVMRSADLSDWEPHVTPSGYEYILIGPRWNCFDSEWVSPVSANWSAQGIHLVYNGGTKQGAKASISSGIGQAVIRPDHVLKTLARSVKPLQVALLGDQGQVGVSATSLGRFQQSMMMLMGSEKAGVYGAMVKPIP